MADIQGNPYRDLQYAEKKNTTMRGYNGNNPNFVDMSKPNNPRYTLTLIIIIHPHPDPY